ncbi:MAG TPA: hypothetical protein VGH84_00730 [Steroidobacteraceae bacterium]
MSWLNRRDCLSLLPGWTAMLETELAETLRARCMVTTATQNIDAAYIALPDDFATMESIRDATTGENLTLKDQWSGHWSETYMRNSSGYTGAYWQVVPNAPVSAYRLVGDCIEWLPHPYLPAVPDPSHVYQTVQMGWYSKPRPLLLPADTNPILEAHYGIYLYGLLKLGAVWALDNDRAQQADGMWQQVITRANLWKQQSDLSGAPLREEMACRF